MDQYPCNSWPPQGGQPPAPPGGQQVQPPCGPAPFYGQPPYGTAPYGPAPAQQAPAGWQAPPPPAGPAYPQPYPQPYPAPCLPGAALRPGRPPAGPPGQGGKPHHEPHVPVRHRPDGGLLPVEPAVLRPDDPGRGWTCSRTTWPTCGSARPWCPCPRPCPSPCTCWWAKGTCPSTCALRRWASSPDCCAWWGAWPSAFWAITPPFSLQDLLGFFGYQPSSSVLGGESTWPSLALEFCSTAVLVPVMEEFAFRGVLFSALRKHGTGFAVVGSALVFALCAPGCLQRAVRLYRRAGVRAFCTPAPTICGVTIAIHGLNNGIAVVSGYLDLFVPAGLADLVSSLLLLVPIALGNCGPGGAVGVPAEALPLPRLAGDPPSPWRPAGLPGPRCGRPCSG